MTIIMQMQKDGDRLSGIDQVDLSLKTSKPRLKWEYILKADMDLSMEHSSLKRKKNIEKKGKGSKAGFCLECSHK